MEDQKYSTLSSNPWSADNLKKYKTKHKPKTNILKIQGSDYKQDDKV